MVGKPNFSITGGNSTEALAALMNDYNGAPLDQEREWSMADEGSFSGALMESEDPIDKREQDHLQAVHGLGIRDEKKPSLWSVAAIGAGLGLMTWGAYHLLQDRDWFRKLRI